MPYPVTFNVDRPASYDRVQVVLRFLLAMLLAAFGCSLGWLFAVLYLGLPAFAAIAISQRGGRRYREELARPVTRFLRWVLALYAYLALLTDRPPASEAQLGIELAVTPGGDPTVGSALLRLLTSLPATLLLIVLGVLSHLAWWIGVVFILVTRALPEALHDFQRGVLRWQARLLVYHASLVEEAPPLALETGATPHAV